MSVPYAVGPQRRTRGRTTPGSLHAGAPWRQVVHIATQEGPRGGEAWVLRLDCDHTAFRPVPPFRFFADGGHAQQPRTAPERVRCLHCGMRAEPAPSEPYEADP